MTIEQLKVDMTSLKAAKLKYRKLVVEVEGLEGGTPRDNLLHTAYKLGDFLYSALPEWGCIDEGG
jgi:hypothetical protein